MYIHIFMCIYIYICRYIYIYIYIYISIIVAGPRACRGTCGRGRGRPSGGMPRAWGTPFVFLCC